jgi:hypothetical protein
MPWDHVSSPLDRTIDQLEWLASQMRHALAAGAEITPADYRVAMLVVEGVVDALRPLQDLRVQERRAPSA